MRTSRRPELASIAVALMLLLTHFVVAKPDATPLAPPSSMSSLESLVQTATGSRSYALGVVALAASDGLDVSSETAIVASGNGSLAAATAALSPGGNLTDGFEAAHAAMDDFTTAATGATASIEGAGLASPTDIQGDLGTLAALNGSTLQISRAIDATCGFSSSATPNSSLFLQGCGAARQAVGNATAQLDTASGFIAAIETGAPGTSIEEQQLGFADAAVQARTDIATASAGLAGLATFTYAARAQAYIDGPLSSLAASANASVASQERLAAWYDTDVTDYRALSSSQISSVDAVTTSASTVATAISSVSVSSLTAADASQQAALTNVLANLTSFSQQVDSLPLPGSILSGLLGNLDSAESSANTYDSSLSSLSDSAGSFSTVALDDYASYTSSFLAADSTESEDAAAFASSFGTFQSQLVGLAEEFPLVGSLSSWGHTMSQLSTDTGAGETTIAQSLSATYITIQALASDIDALTMQTQAIQQVEVSSSLLQNVSSVSTSESAFLNTTSMGSISSADASLSTDAQMASSFVTSSQALLATTVGGFASSSQALSAQSSSLSIQSQSTSNSLSSASQYLKADLDARSADLAAAQAAVAQAVSLFDVQNVSQGAAELSAASAEFAAATSSSVG